MCERIDPLDQLRRIPFKVASLQKALTHGSYEQALAGCVYDSVRAEIESAIKQLEFERDEDKRRLKGS